MRPSERVLIGVLGAATVVAVIAGVQRAPRGDLRDPRLSTQLAGPDGARGLSEALERVGVPVVVRTRGLFDLGADTLEVSAGDLVALLDVSDRPTHAERRALVRYVERGGSVVLVGWNYGVEACFNVEVVWPGQRIIDSLEVALPPGIASLPKVTTVLEFPHEEEPDEERAAASSDGECVALNAMRVDTLLKVQDGRPVALDLYYAAGGRVLAISDPSFFRNETLKETDAGVIVLQWLLSRAPRRMVVDEYHHGFGNRTSMFVAAWDWMRGNPAGWTLLQLCVVSLVVIFAAAVRFGPAMEVVERQRRSAIEHVDALSVGLQRASGRQAAVHLMIQGLRRRLGRRDLRDRPTSDQERWLSTLALGVREPEAREQIDTLSRLARDASDDEQVLAVAQTVEDVWEALGHEKTPKQF